MTASWTSSPPLTTWRTTVSPGTRSRRRRHERVVARDQVDLARSRAACRARSAGSARPRPPASHATRAGTRSSTSPSGCVDTARSLWLPMHVSRLASPLDTPMAASHRSRTRHPRARPSDQPVRALGHPDRYARPDRGCGRRCRPWPRPSGLVPAVRLEGVAKRYGDVVAVDGIDLDVRDGEFFSMLGPSGSGKTTTLRMIAGFEQPTAGRILLHGARRDRRPAVRSGREHGLPGLRAVPAHVRRRQRRATA